MSNSSLVLNEPISVGKTKDKELLFPVANKVMVA